MIPLACEAKPMVEIGSQPILWHIMKIYDKFGFNEFILPLGYKGEYIKNYFINYKTINSNLKIDLDSGEVSSINNPKENWKVSLIDTGKKTLTGGRLLRLKEYVKDGTFMMTYGDGVSDINIDDLLNFHKSHGRIATVTAVRPQARFGGLHINENNLVESFVEKPSSNENNESWINGGYFVFNKQVFDYLEDDMTILERSPLENLSKDGQLMSFKHNGFWQCMDTIRDKEFLNQLLTNKNAPWV